METYYVTKYVVLVKSNSPQISFKCRVINMLKTDNGTVIHEHGVFERHMHFFTRSCFLEKIWLALGTRLEQWFKHDLGYVIMIINHVTQTNLNKEVLVILEV